MRPHLACTHHEWPIPGFFKGGLAGTHLCDCGLALVKSVAYQQAFGDGGEQCFDLATAMEPL